MVDQTWDGVNRQRSWAYHFEISVEEELWLRGDCNDAVHGWERRDEGRTECRERGVLLGKVPDVESARRSRAILSSNLARFIPEFCESFLVPERVSVSGNGSDSFCIDFLI